MQRKTTISEARQRLPSLVQSVERGDSVELTRHGKPVAVLISVREYQQLQASRPGLWDAITAFRDSSDLGALDIDVDRVFGDIRDSSAGRDVDL